MGVLGTDVLTLMQHSQFERCARAGGCLSALACSSHYSRLLRCGRGEPEQSAEQLQRHAAAAAAAAAAGALESEMLRPQRRTQQDRRAMPVLLFVVFINIV